MQDINNPLEQLKVEQALRSENMKLKYRKSNKPSDVNILDYTVIAALEKQIPKALDYEGDGYSEGELVYDTAICRSCEKHFEVDYDEQSNYCPNCGQKLDWGN